MPDPVTILTADDHPLIREGIAALIAPEPDLKVVAEASNGEEALERYREHRPQVVLMDLRMPVMDGLAATRAILEEDPDGRIVVLTTYDGDEDIYRALQAGAKGYLLKDMIGAEVLKVVRAVHRGLRGIPAPVAARLTEHTPRVELTPREIEILQHVALGMSNAEIGAQLGCAEGTVKVHVKNTMQKLEAEDRTAAVTRALRRGIIRLD
jgi:DNA-binding NarL/FixJ family response regulator